jgi:hypothetical protein
VKRVKPCSLTQVNSYFERIDKIRLCEIAFGKARLYTLLDIILSPVETKMESLKILKMIMSV